MLLVFFVTCVLNLVFYLHMHLVSSGIHTVSSISFITVQLQIVGEICNYFEVEL